MLEILNVWPVLIPQDRGCVQYCGWVPCVQLWCQLGLKETNPMPGEMFLWAEEEGELGRTPVLFWSAITENGRTLKRLVGQLKEPQVLKFVTISFSVSWIFAIIVRLGGFGLHLEAFICWNWRLRIWGVFLWSYSSDCERGSWHIKRRVDTVFHFDRIKSYSCWINIWRNTRIYLKTVRS